MSRLSTARLQSVQKISELRVLTIEVRPRSHAHAVPHDVTVKTEERVRIRSSSRIALLSMCNTLEVIPQFCDG